MIKVLKSGLHSSIQDSGRFGYKKYGIPVSGFMDKFSGELANLILGNPKGFAVLEMTMIGAKLQFNVSTQIVVSGAYMSPMINGILINNNVICQIAKGDILSFGKLQSGLHCYLAVKGGFKTKVVYGSQSFFKPVTTQNSIKKDDTLLIEEFLNKFNQPKTLSKLKLKDFSIKTLKVYKGPEFDLLSEEQKIKLVNGKFTISSLYNRMAYQILPLLENTLNSIITSPVLPGTIQLTPSGQLIVLMRDCQTTGGYPRVLQLSETAINLLSQKKERDEISFCLINY